MNIVGGRSWQSFLLFYGIAFFIFISMDPGIINWFQSLHYDLHEGEFPLLRILALLASSIIVATPIIIPIRWVQLVYIAGLAVLNIIGLSFRFINGQFTHWEAMLTINELGFAGSAITEFINIIAFASMLTISALCALFFLRPRMITPLMSAPKITSAVLFIPWLMPLLYLFVTSGGYLMTHFALPMKVASSLIFVAQKPLYQGERMAVNSSKHEKVSNYHVMLIVDESIRGDLLSINGGPESSTPYLSALFKQEATKRNFYAHNYGVVNSMANCSATSNLLLRTGIMAQRLPLESDALFKQPNIFQYANVAGFYSIYMDAQVKGHRLNNFFTQREINHIDEYWVMNNHHDLSEHELDQQMAKDIEKRIVNTENPQFYYINKSGTHFPYESTLPVEKYPVSKEKNETYMQALNWSVDEFFKVLIPAVSRAKLPVIIIYTSDHGQGLGEQGNLSTHCLPKNVPIEQALVPLLMINVSDNQNSHLIQPFEQKSGLYSQYQVFPTLLTLFGYSNLIEEHGVDLSQPWNHPIREFLSGDISGRGKLYKNRFDWPANGL